MDDDVAIAENRHISENLEHFEDPVSTMRAQNSVKFADNIVENHPETDRFGFFTIQNKW